MNKQDSDSMSKIYEDIQEKQKAGQRAPNFDFSQKQSEQSTYIINQKQSKNPIIKIEQQPKKQLKIKQFNSQEVNTNQQVQHSKIATRYLNNKIHQNKQKRQFQTEIDNFIGDVKRTKTKQFKEQLIYQIKQKILSQQSILKQMGTISNRIFDFPKTLNSNNLDQIIFRSVVLRFGDIYQLGKTQQQKIQIKQIMDNYRVWGFYYVNPVRLESQGKLKQRKNNQTIYEDTFYNLKIIITGNIVKVYYKDKQITPQDFKINILRKMALQSCQQYAQDILRKFMQSKILNSAEGFEGE